MIWREVRDDLRAMQARDPASRGVLDVLLFAPGMHALWRHRIEHALWARGLRVLSRYLAYRTRRKTGVEIHPGARIGRRVVIDHGMGVVIGETAVVGDDVHLYSGVVLGATSRRPGVRHPTVEDGVVLGAQAIVLGAVRIGRGAKIGAGAVVRHDVPPGWVVCAISRGAAGREERPETDRASWQRGSTRSSPELAAPGGVEAR
jgi:serine O-acetyltransferase